MKCNAKIIYYKEKTTKGKERIAYTVNPDLLGEEVVGMIPRTSIPKVSLSKVNRCQGKIVIFVTAEEEPYMGGSSATLEVNYRCDTCGHRFYPRLPTSYNINEWLTKVIEELPDNYKG